MPISLSKNGEISPEKENTISVLLGWSFLSVGLHQALANVQLFFFSFFCAGYV
jgi:hypothetical protein